MKNEQGWSISLSKGATLKLPGSWPAWAGVKQAVSAWSRRRPILRQATG